MSKPLLILLACGLAGCASIGPVPVVEAPAPTRVEGPKPAPAPAAPPAAAAGKLHTVKKGDTLFSIARQHGVSTQDLAAWNNLDGTHRILVGQQLRTSPPAAAGAGGDAAEVHAVALGGGVVARPLDGAPSSAPLAAPPAPGFASGNDEKLKRAPRGGKLPYSEENLALLKAQEGAPVPVVAPPPVVAAPAAPSPAPAPAAPPSPPAVSDIEWGWPAAGKLLANFSDGASGQEVNRGIDIAGKIGDPVLAAAAGKVIFVGVYPKHGNLVVLLHGGGYSSVYAHNSRIHVKEGQFVKRGERIAELGDSDADQPKLHFEVRQQGKPVDPVRLLPSRS